MTENILHIYNGFGIMPKNTFISAGTDYFIPNINCADIELRSIVIDAFKKSYKITDDGFYELTGLLTEYVGEEKMKANDLNIIHLYLALGSRKLEDIRAANGNINALYNIEDICYFVEHYLVFDNNGIPGVCVDLNDTLFINSGIKIALHKNDAGLYVNKSGMGNRGWDVRAQLVDEDYTGYVHLSCAFTKDTAKKAPRTVYCGDKVTQMMIMEVKHYKITESTLTEYNKIMADSQRGDDAFGSSDVKH